MFLSCIGFLITQPCLNIYRHAVQQIRAEYYRYPLEVIILYNSGDIQLKSMKEIENSNL